MTTHTGKIYECDGCRRRVPEEEPGVEAAKGFHFHGVLHIHEGGGDSFAMDAFACSVTCLSKALEKSYQRYEEGEPS